MVNAEIDLLLPSLNKHEGSWTPSASRLSNALLILIDLNRAFSDRNIKQTTGGASRLDGSFGQGRQGRQIFDVMVKYGVCRIFTSCAPCKPCAPCADISPYMVYPCKQCSTCTAFAAQRPALNQWVQTQVLDNSAINRIKPRTDVWFSNIPGNSLP